MKLSKFNIFILDYPEQGEWLVYNTLTQGMAVIDRRTKGLLHSLPWNSLDGATDDLEELKETGIVVDKELDEWRLLDVWFGRMKYSRKQLQATIVTTYRCNFACTYCFEENVQKDLFMSEEVCKQTVEWLKQEIEEKGFRELELVFYGGEPLLNIPAVDYFTRTLSQWTKERGVRFSFSFITNGSLLRPALVEKLLPLGLDTVKITLDGFRDFHNSRRPSIDGKGTFDLIIDNICSVADKVKVRIGGNMDHENIESIPALLDHLVEKGISKKLDSIGFTPVIARLGKNPGDVELKECMKFMDEGLFDKAYYLRNEMLKRGFNPVRKQGGVPVNGCPLILDNTGVAIDPVGDIYKCNALLGYKDFVVGNVKQQELNWRNVEFMTLNTWRKCGDCPYIPVCAGGCRFWAFLENGNFEDICCKKDYYERICREMIKRDYEENVANMA